MAKIFFSENILQDLIKFLKKEVIEVALFYEQEVLSVGKNGKSHNV